MILSPRQSHDPPGRCRLIEVLALVGASPFAHSSDRRYWKSGSFHISAEEPGVILNRPSSEANFHS